MTSPSSPPPAPSRVWRSLADFGSWPDGSAWPDGPVPADVGTLIISNGSKWGGEEPDGLDALYARLRVEPIRHDFVRRHPVVSRNRGGDYEGWSDFLGNFEDVSAVFQVVSRDPEVVETLRGLIRDNLRRFWKVTGRGRDALVERIASPSLTLARGGAS